MSLQITAIISEKLCIIRGITRYYSVPFIAWVYNDNGLHRTESHRGRSSIIFLISQLTLTFHLAERCPFRSLVYGTVHYELDFD